MAGPSTSRVLTELEQLHILNEFLDAENIGEFSFNNKSISNSDCTQLVTQEPMCDSSNGSDEQE
jgi:hypothetical protein